MVTSLQFSWLLVKIRGYLYIDVDCNFLVSRTQLSNILVFVLKHTKNTWATRKCV